MKSSESNDKTFVYTCVYIWASLVAQWWRIHLGCKCRRRSSTPGSGRPPGGGHGNPLQCSCLENPMDRGGWQAQSIESKRVRRDWSNLAHMHVYMYIYIYDLSKLAREEKVLLFIGGSSPNLPLCPLKKKNRHRKRLLCCLWVFKL